MRIAILGAGNVGSALGRKLSASGHEIVFGVRDPASAKIKALLGQVQKSQAMEVGDAAEEAEIVLLATPWSATRDVLQTIEDFAGKVVIDCTNPLKDALAGLAVGFTTSGGELVASWAHHARVVKAFNTTGSKNMEHPSYGKEKITMLICGDDADAKKTVTGLGEQIGFDMIDAGALQVSRYLEPMAMLWIHLAFVQGKTPDIAFFLRTRA